MTQASRAWPPDKTIHHSSIRTSLCVKITKLPPIYKSIEIIVNVRDGIWNLVSKSEPRNKCLVLGAGKLYVISFLLISFIIDFKLLWGPNTSHRFIPTVLQHFLFISLSFCGMKSWHWLAPWTRNYSPSSLLTTNQQWCLMALPLVVGCGTSLFVCATPSESEISNLDIFVRTNEDSNVQTEWPEINLLSWQ